MGIIKMVFSLGVGHVVGNACRAVQPANAGKIGKILTGIGSFAFGWAAGSMVEKEVDKLVNDFKKIETEEENN